MSEERTETEQRPIGSGFGRGSTNMEVIDGINLRGKTAIVTGGYSGLGLETVRALVSAGAEVTVPARRLEHARSVLADAGLSESVRVEQLDLADQESVKGFARRFLEDHGRLDILVNNAAIMASPEQRVGPGWEAQFATNHLGHYTLVNTLWPALQAAGNARVVSLSSTGHKLSPIRFDDINFTGGYDKWKAYGQAKTANALFAVELDHLGRESGVRAFAVHPGGIMTELQRHLPKEEMVAAGWMDAAGNVREVFKTPEQGAATSVWAATSPALNGMGGVYCEDCDIAKPTDKESPLARYQGVDAHAVDKEDAARLWALSAELTGVNAFA
ncbi:NAD(P)-dependent dehydrogenase (short-subunit alcohol dehydrogenase family) [Paenarthrobacter nicotinovorans]|uniref:SDR family NAD(P)-dependent oxidoreductase n=1 Tax=Paenarthrobacter nicotinovorans TaxID=29320 RepID=UPI002788FC5A|nr:SDR family NAD(P)-dependent oxidoreductase [Paenarthrobacter nicotinovorans]MDP9935349.1 NAD(P)-dependent dehydrogenase (short-subunit alcohol dehydrogenase family) [Paenarthrobacter nicotinovorans]